MRTLTVCNFVTVDGMYEDDDHDIVSFFEHWHPDYHGADSFDFHTTALLREAGTLLLSGRRSFLGNMTYWASVLEDPNATSIRREFAELIMTVEKVVVSDTISDADVAEWPHTRIVRIADAHREVRGLKQGHAQAP